MACATQAGLAEAWIAKQPFLAFVYLAYYVPDMFRKLFLVEGRKRLAKQKAKAE